MPKRKGDVMLSRLVDSSSDDQAQDSGEEMIIESRIENVEPAKKARARSKVATKKVGGAKQPLSAAAQESTTVAKKTVGRKNTTAKRQALKEKRNDQYPSDIDELEDPEARVNNDAAGVSVASGDELDVPVVAVKQPGKRRKPLKKTDETALLEEVKSTMRDEPAVDSSAPTKKSKTKSKASSVASKSAARKHNPPLEDEHAEEIIPETQQVPMDIDQSLGSEEGNATSRATAQAVTKRTTRNPTESNHNHNQLARKRAGSASDVEKGGSDPATRRRLGELTKKMENMDMKYQNLREVGIKEAEANFEKLKKHSEERSRAANELIASLKKELSTQTTLAQESRSLQKQLSSKDSELSHAQGKVEQLSTSLLEARNENKAVQAKLAASRTAAVSVESVNAKVPGSAMKSNGQIRTLMVGSAEAAQAAQVAQLKEDLYSDLTGLILRGVKRGDDLEVYDCIQTGRNGTLHFKLAIATEGNGKGTSYEDTEFQYTPHLDAGRDSQLLELLPDYLTEEITFSRQNAAKFYGRVVEALTKKKQED